MKAVRWMRFAVVVLTVASGPALVAGERSRGDLDGLQGTWSGAAGAKKKVVVTVEIHGATVAVVVPS